MTRGDEEETLVLPAITEADTVVLSTVTDELTRDSGTNWPHNRVSIGKATGTMAIAGLFSKVTGFARTLIIVWVLGFSASADAYNAANSMPNQVYELMVGGVLTSVLVPLLTRARKDDTDKGEVYTQRLFTLTTVALLVVTLLALICVPLLTALLVNNSNGMANPALTKQFAYLLMPQILFYGLSALFNASLNSSNVFTAPAWAPVLNNVILISTFGVYLLPGMMPVGTALLDSADILFLGLGSTLGVALQAFVMIPSLRRTGFRFRLRFGWDHRFAEFGGLALWTIAYALLAQVGVVAVTNVTTAHGGLTIYNNVWLLVQLPYGILGFALITAILPRLSHAAADNNLPHIKKDLSLATRLSTVAMLPMSVLLTVLGPSLSTALFSVGKGNSETDTLGIALASAGFGVLPYAMTLIQLRVFYALKDARTPTLIMLMMVASKVAMTYLSPVVLPHNAVVYGVLFANSFSFVLGWAGGEVILRRRLGALNLGLPKVFAKSSLASSATAIIALLIQAVASDGVIGSWVALTGGSVGGLAGAFTIFTLTKSSEVQFIIRRFGGPRQGANELT